MNFEAKSSVDLFSQSALLDPYPIYRELREAGSTVWMSALGHYALPRYHDVHEALRDWRTFSSASGVLLDEFVNTASAGTVLASDNPDHAAKRKVLTRPLMPGLVLGLKDQITEEAVQCIGKLAGRDTFEAVREVAWHLPLTIISRFVGLAEEGREQMLHWS